MLTYPGYATLDEQEPYMALGDFDSTSTFWGNYTHFLQPSFCFSRPDCTKRPTVDGDVIEGIALFRDDITPLWEDMENMHGGHWQASVVPWDRIDDLWDALVMALVGNFEENNDVVTGMRAVDKSKPKSHQLSYRVEVWCSFEKAPFAFMTALGLHWRWISHQTAINSFETRQRVH